MNKYLKGLFYAVLGGVIVLLIENVFFNSKADYQNRLNAEHRKVKITAAESIVGNLATNAIFDNFYKRGGCPKKEAEKCKAMVKQLIKRVDNFEYFDNRLYTVVHELSLKNETDYTVSNIAIEHSFDYFGYVYFKTKDKTFHILKPKEVFKIDELRPGKKVEMTFFSQAGFSDSEDNINITESGKKVDVMPLFGDSSYDGIYEEELEWAFRFITENPFFSYMIIVISMLSLLLIVLTIIINIVYLLLPDASIRYEAKNMSENTYERQKLIIDSYEQNKQDSD